MMDYEKLHKETLNRLQQMVSCGKITVETARGICADFVPESKDEIIRKGLIRAFQSFNTVKVWNGIERTDILAWLEKQGEQKSTARYKVGDTIYYNSFGRLVSFVIANIIEDGTGDPMYVDKNGNSVFQSDIVERKPNDKAEPKFHEGEWIISDTVHNDYHICKIIGVTDISYTIESIYGCIGYNKFDVFDASYRPWTIQDAKPGDVLVTINENIFIVKSIDDCVVYDYCGLYFGNFMTYSGPVNSPHAVQLPVDYRPATKEQRDLLFQKMKEAGYEWDAEKKELKKVGTEF